MSFFYWEGFIKHQPCYRYRDLALDSGAFSAANSGAKIDLQEFTDTALAAMANPAMKLTEVFALDVIGDPEASIRNCEEMVRQGVPAIPCFHYGSPWHYLEDIARRFPKIALGGVAAKVQSRKLQWAEQCFARVWPCKVHGFAFCGEKSLMLLPWHSVDATSWELGPCKFGNWKSYGQMSVRGSQQDLSVEIAWYLDLEKKARRRWSRVWTENELTLRLAHKVNGQGDRHLQ